MAASQPAVVTDASLALRVAQRAFALLLERSARLTTFRFAQLRSGARRTLSALSADDRVRLTRWLALLCAAGDENDREAPDQRLARVDATLAASVATVLASLREQRVAKATGAAAA
jgi:hypothetical protein